MDAILDEYRSIAATVTYSKPTCGFVSGMDGRIIGEDEQVDAEYFVRHTRDRVQFVNASKAILEEGCRLFLEIGPHPVLSALAMGNSEELAIINSGEPIEVLPSIRRQEPNWKTILTSLSKLYMAGMPINWKRFYQYSTGKKVALPFYPFQNKPIWFNLPDQGPRQFHPLVGAPLPNASSVKLFSNKLELEDAPFLHDHVIGNQIVFPGAGFIEMCLVGGHAATQCTESGYFHPPSPITIENFVIESPLGLVDKETTQLQVMLSSEDSGERRIQIYSKSVLDKQTCKWVRHASSTFSPFAVLSKEEEQRWATMSFDLSTFKANKSSQLLCETYSKLRDFGLKFGASFQTIRNMWGGSEEGEMFFEVGVTASSDKYICHPVLTDALFQAIMFTIHPEVDSLHVPVSVKKFICFSRVETEICFIRCHQNKEGDEEAVVAGLYDSNGKLCSLMVGALLVETNVSSIMSALEAQKLSLPDMYTEVWKVGLGPQERRVDPLECFNSEIFSPAYQAELTMKYNELSEVTERYVNDVDHLCSLYMQMALLKLGWEPEVGRLYEYSPLVESLKIIPSISGLFRYFLIQLAADGFFETTDTTRHQMTFRSLKALRKKEEIDTELENLRSRLSLLGMESEFVGSTGDHLAEILTGKDSALHRLFPEDATRVSAESYYVQGRMCKVANESCKESMLKMCETCPDNVNSGKKVIRVLEIGAGTGSATKCAMPCFLMAEEGWEYTYTDLSTAFFSAGERIFDGSRIKVLYRLLNIEEDPVSQGFIPHHYDWIIANNVIHATKSIKQTLTNLRYLLRDNGMITVMESIKPCRPTNITFGCLEGYWLFNDFELRPYACEISEESWRRVLRKTGFGDTFSTPAYRNHIGIVVARALPCHGSSIMSQSRRMLTDVSSTWIVFSLEDQLSHFCKGQLSKFGDRIISVTKSLLGFEVKDCQNFAVRSDAESDFEKLFEVVSKSDTVGSIKGVIFLWGMENGKGTGTGSICEPYLYLCKQFIERELPRLYTFTRGAFSVEDHTVAEPYVSPIVAMTKCIQNEHHGSKCRVVDFEVTEEASSAITRSQMEEAFSELIVDDNEIYVAYREHQRIVPRLQHWKDGNNKPLSLPSTERFRMLLSPSNTISNLRIGQAESSSSKLMKEDEIEVKVKSYALNFRDVFAVLKPSVEFETMNSVGIDFSGVVTAVGESVRELRVGDAVFGCNLSNEEAMPSHIVTFEDNVIRVPESMTFNEAATLPAVAATAYLSLVQVAKLRREDVVLIHAGSGGVGLVAIQIAQHIGATIIATAGSERKRSYLRRLGVKHVFQSRNTSYEKDIRQALNGRGVDVVLNSLTSEGFKEASISVCNEGARFIEMSKLNVWTAEEVKGLRPDVQYTIVDLSAFNRTQMRGILTKINEWIEDSRIRPISYTRFDFVDVREALTYLQKAKHIGKVICVMPDKDHASQSITGDLSSSIPLFNERSTYLITGGLGGIGWEVAKWMVKSGAKHVALVGRNPPSVKLSGEIHQINDSSRKNLFYVQCDIGNMGECKALLDKLNSLELPPLRGIMHAAGVLSDASFAKQTWGKYEKTFGPKVKGGWNLHNLTLGYALEHFVMFSSFVAKIGSSGQSNHASANFFLDSLSAHRNYIGLPSNTINWGQWGGVGAAAEIELIGLQPFSPLQGISALERIMRSQSSQTTVLEKSDFPLFRRFLPAVRKYFEDIKCDDVDSAKGTKVKTSDQFWKSYDESLEAESKINIVKDLVKSVVSSILKLEGNCGDMDNFQDLGMDSLMMIEMKNALQSIMGKRVTITVSSLKDCHNVNQLAVKLGELIGAIGVGNNDAAAISQANKETAQEILLAELAQKNPKLASEIMSGDRSMLPLAT
jgi:NADPH:quinone reductase-like Zn-dependent oxidoreductase/acyl carrier protein